MSNKEFQQQLHEYADWKNSLIQAIEDYQAWLESSGIGRPEIDLKIMETLSMLHDDKIMVAFVAEFSRGKTELINALFFADTGARLLPSAPGRTTMCPTELFYTNKDSAYIRLLAIETRLEELSINDLKNDSRRWVQIDLDPSDPKQLQEAFQKLVEIKHVSIDEAIQLGLYQEEILPNHKSAPKTVEIPCWRHALVNFPHPLLEKGLSILDTPGLNALGSEPELTLNMLPSAQAMIFLLAADAGVTKSDMDIWQHHIRNYRSSHEKGQMVILNKIDTLWDDLHDDETIEASIQAQVAMTASTLGIKDSMIFPLSAKQALLGKVKNNPKLIKKSRIEPLADFLLDNILNDKQKILEARVTEDISLFVDESASVISSRIKTLSSQLKDLHKLEGQNTVKTQELLQKTRGEQKLYQKNVDRLRSTRKVFIGQAQQLIDALNPVTAEEIIHRAKRQMIGSWTTTGMKKAMKMVFDELHVMLDSAVDNTEETSRLVKAIYRQFEEEHDFEKITPKLFTITRHKLELERLFEEGEHFRNSATTALMEQGLVVKKLFGSIISQAYEILDLAHKEATIWGGVVLNPLLQQVKEHRQQTERKLEILCKINESSNSLTANTIAISSQLTGFQEEQKQLLKIQTLIKNNAGPVIQELPQEKEDNTNPFAFKLV